jgi:hypothetical protein
MHPTSMAWARAPFHEGEEMARQRILAHDLPGRCRQTIEPVPGVLVKCDAYVQRRVAASNRPMRRTTS